MTTEEIVSKKVRKIMEDKSILQNVKNPAIRDAFETVLEINKSDMNNGYTKHSQHTKTSTKGCAMGCLGG